MQVRVDNVATAWRHACYGAVCSECHERQLDAVRAEGVLGAAFPTLSRLRTDWTHIDIDWDSLDLPVPGRALPLFWLAAAEVALRL